MYNINHVCFSVSNLQDSIKFYQDIFRAKLLVQGNTTAYFDLSGLWIALNEQSGVPRNEIHQSYSHIAFSATEAEIELLEKKARRFNVNLIGGRERHSRDEKSLYIRDPDGHLLEFHCGTLQQRLDYYREEKPHMRFY